MAKSKTTKSTAPLKFDKRLVLNEWLLSLFEVSSIDEFYGIKYNVVDERGQKRGVGYYPALRQRCSVMLRSSARHYSPKSL